MLEMLETVFKYSGARMRDKLWWFGTHWSGLDDHIFDDITDQDVELCRLIATKALRTDDLTDDQKERLSIGIERGYIERSGDRLRLSFPFFLGEQMKSLAEMLKRAYSDLGPIIGDSNRDLRDRFISQVPTLKERSTSPACVHGQLRTRHWRRV